MTFLNTQRASHHFAPELNEEIYFQRTKRNHFWLNGLAGQQKLKDLRVGIAGLGGMGSNIAEIMVRLGVGHIKIADPDTIEISNINRQVIANKETVGCKKAHASFKELRTIATDFELVVYDQGITEDNAEEFVEDLDVLINEVDVGPLYVHQWLHQAARKNNIPIYSGFIIGIGTHIYKFQGSAYTFEEFMQFNQEQIKKPTADFLADVFLKPEPDYLCDREVREKFQKTIESNNIPIFGASTFASQSVIAVRVIADYLQLHKNLGGVETPVMPYFIKLDPLDLCLKVCDAREPSQWLKTPSIKVI
ncbi:MAG: ThiF family adenylyltransferase [Bdellovibrionaceae bacterium]|nr:ThiF family adenylyltransferase [Pseudobdellovibrionaceae bacterium]